MTAVSVIEGGGSNFEPSASWVIKATGLTKLPSGSVWLLLNAGEWGPFKECRTSACVGSALIVGFSNFGLSPTERFQKADFMLVRGEHVAVTPSGITP
jgi:hypothetical protein